MSKITIAELASVLMEKHGLKRTEAELFIRQLVIVVNESLKKDKVAKIKGLGTFKVQSVSARKSVDVNTGESIVIEGRDKISFTADAAMRDLVNAPFAQFETVVVNDGVDFSSIDDTVIDEINDLEKAKETSSDNKVIVSDKQDNKVEEDNITTLANPDSESINSVSINNENVNVSNVTNVSSNYEDTEVEDTNNSTTISTNTANNTASEQLELPLDDTQSQKVDTTEYDTETQEAANSFNNQTHSIRQEKEEIDLETQNFNNALCNYQKRVRILSVCLISVAVLAVAGIVYTGTLIEKSNNRIEHLIAQNNNLVNKLTQVNKSTIENKTSSEQDSIKAINDSLAKVVKQNAENATKANEQSNDTKANKIVDNNKIEQQKAADEKKNPTTIPSQDAYNKDPRIRTGAYVITGIAKTVTAKEGQTLASISKTYLGAGMECYMEAVNGGDKVLKVGDKVKIPELKTKKSLNK